MGDRPRGLALALLIALPFAATSVPAIPAFADEPEPASLHLSSLSISADFLPSLEDPGAPNVDGGVLAQGPPGAAVPTGQPQGESLFGRRPMTRGSWEAGVLFARMIPGPGGPDLKHVTPDKKFPKGDVRGYWLLPRVGYTFWEIPWYPGSFQAYIEPAVAYITTPTHSYMLGVNLMLRHTLLVWRRFSPYIEGGAGLMNTNLRNQVLGDSIQFMPQAGGGLRVNVFEGLSVDIGYRFHHISDAGLTERNRGINSHLPYIGFTHFF